MTSFPHQWSAMVPSRGKIKTKKTAMALRMVPVSMAALVMKLYLLHQANLLLRMTYWKMKPTKNHEETTMPDAGGTAEVPVKKRGTLIVLKKRPGHRRAAKKTGIGATQPTSIAQ